MMSPEQDPSSEKDRSLSDPKDTPSPDEGSRIAPDPDGEFADGTSALFIRQLKHAPQSDSVWSYLSDRYRNRLLLYADHRLGPKLRSVCDPDDVVATAMMRAVKEADSFEYTGPASFFRWLCQKVNWEILDRAREQVRRQRAVIRDADLQSSWGAADPPAPHTGPRTEVMRRDPMEKLTASLERVPETYRRVLVARFIEDKSRQEIARELGLKPNTVTQQIIRGLEYWRQILGQDPLTHI